MNSELSLFAPCFAYVSSETPLCPVAKHTADPIENSILLNLVTRQKSMAGCVLIRNRIGDFSKITDRMALTGKDAVNNICNAGNCQYDRVPKGSSLTLYSRTTTGISSRRIAANLQFSTNES